MGEAGGAMTWHPLIGRSEVAAGGGHVRRGVDASGGARGGGLGFGLRDFGGDHIFIGRGS